nr:uncharacterized protein LOC109164785 [Ipomoea batatas]
MSSYNTSSADDVRCRCGYLAPLKMSWSYANPGKRYRACPRYGGNESCRYFEWMDYDVSERVAKVIRGLLKKANNYEKEIEKLNLTSKYLCFRLSNQYIAHNRLLHHFFIKYASEYEYLMPPTVIYFFVVDVGSLAAIKSETVRIALAPAVL